jgi:CcmD family protein
MGQDGKIYVVLAVVLLIWIGVVALLFRTDRRIERLERRIDRSISEDE